MNMEDEKTGIAMESIELETLPGDRIDNTAQEAIDLSRAFGGRVVWFKFNDARLEVTADDLPDAVVARYHAELERIANLSENVERRRKYEEESERDRIEKQTLLDRAILLLNDGQVDITKPEMAIQWLCSVQDSMDRIGVTCDRAAIVARFEVAGYKRGALCSRSHAGVKETTKEWRKRVGKNGERKWIIGQALDGIATVGAPHYMVTVFAERAGIV